MCGIGAIINLGNNKKAELQETVTNILLKLEERGKEATGVSAVYHDKKKNEFKAFTLKGPITASEFVESKEFLKFIDSYWDARLFLLHTRLPTQGNPKKNKNNHPLISENFILVHNGSIRNEKIGWLYHKGIDEEVETDSYAILRIAETEGLEKALKILEGNMTILAFNKATGEFYAYKERMPLHVGYCPERKLLVFASTEEAISSAFTHRRELFNIIPIEKKEFEHVTTSLKQDVLYSAKVFEDNFRFSRLIIEKEEHEVQSEYMDLVSYYRRVIFFKHRGFYFIKFKTDIKKKLRKALDKKFKKFGEFYKIPEDKWEDFMEEIRKYGNRAISEYVHPSYYPGRYGFY